MEWIYFVIIFFYILSALSKAARKKQQEAEKAEAAKQMNRHVQARPVEAQPAAPSRFEKAAEAFTDLPLGDVMRFIAERTEQRKTEEVDYDLTARFEPVAENETGGDREHTTVSHFRSAEGMRSSVHDRSSLATAPAIVMPTFAFAKRHVAKRRLTLAPGDLKKYFVASEILGKPKALRRR